MGTCLIALILLFSPIWVPYMVGTTIKNNRKRSTYSSVITQETIDRDIQVVKEFKRTGKIPTIPVVDPVILVEPDTDIPTDSEYRMNVAPDPTDTRWFLCTHKDLPAPSAAEQKIITALDQYNIQWVREISFYGLQFTTYSHPRFDFYLPRYRTIIEYDGQLSHSTPEQKKIDRSKEKFCKDNSIKVIRYNKKHYYHIQTHIDDLMRSLNVRKKS